MLVKNDFFWALVKFKWLQNTKKTFIFNRSQINLESYGIKFFLIVRDFVEEDTIGDYKQSTYHIELDMDQLVHEITLKLVSVFYIAVRHFHTK